MYSYNPQPHQQQMSYTNGSHTNSNQTLRKLNLLPNPAGGGNHMSIQNYTPQVHGAQMSSQPQQPKEKQHQKQQQQQQFQQGVRLDASEYGVQPSNVVLSNNIIQQPYSSSNNKSGTPILTTTGIQPSSNGLPSQTIQQQVTPFYLTAATASSYQQYSNLNQQKTMQGQVNLNSSGHHSLPLQPSLLSSNPSSSDQALSSANATSVMAKSPRLATNLNQVSHQNTFHVSTGSLNNSLPNVPIPTALNDPMMNYSQPSSITTTTTTTTMNKPTLYTTHVVPGNSVIFTNVNTSKKTDVPSAMNYNKQPNNNKRNKKKNNNSAIGREGGAIIGQAILQKPQQLPQSSATMAAVTQRVARSRTPFTLSPYARLAKHQSDYIQGTVMRPQLEQTLHNNPFKNQPLYYDQLINFPRARYMDDLRCVMCGLRPHPKEKELNAFGESNDPHYCIIPRQNKDVCKECDKGTWYHIVTNQYFKWCKGCKKFLKLTDFVQKLDASKCDRCRERGRVSYIEKKKIVEEGNLNNSNTSNDKSHTDSEEYENDKNKPIVVEEVKLDANEPEKKPAQVSSNITFPFNSLTVDQSSSVLLRQINENENTETEVTPLSENTEISQQENDKVSDETQIKGPLKENKKITVENIPSKSPLSTTVTDQEKTTKLHGALNENPPTAQLTPFIETKNEIQENIPHGSAGSKGISNKLNTLEYGTMKNLRGNTILHRGDTVVQTITPPLPTYPTTSSEFNNQPHILETLSSDGTNMTNNIMGNSTILMEQMKAKSITSCSSTSANRVSDLDLNQSNDSTYIDDQNTRTGGVKVLPNSQVENYHHSFSHPSKRSEEHPDMSQNYEKKFEEQEALIAKLQKHISNIEGDFHKTKTENNMLQKQIQEYLKHKVIEPVEEYNNTVPTQKHNTKLNLSYDDISKKNMYINVNVVNQEVSARGKEEISCGSPSNSRKRQASDMSQPSDHQEDLSKSGFEMESTNSLSTKTANTNVNQINSDGDTRSSVISQDQGSLEEKNSHSSFDKGCEEMKLFPEAKKTKLMPQNNNMTKNLNVQI